MNPRLDALHPYPFEKLRQLMAGSQPPAGLRPVGMSIGEPRHATPSFIRDAMCAGLDGLAAYPATRGSQLLRETIADWLARRYDIPAPDAQTQVLPVLGSREALFAFAQTVIDGAASPIVLCPNPFYQIYEGAALLAGARPVYVNADPARNFGCDWASVPEATWRETRLVYVCSPGNPAGNVMDLEEWKLLFGLADRHGFVIAADECYSEIYLDESAPPLGALQAARLLGNTGYRNLMVFSSLSKRSNVPGMRSGFVAGDADLVSRFLLYRTYHGSAMSDVVSHASIAAWRDEAHVQDNRRQYREKFEAVLPILEPVLDTPRPQASFYLWAGTPISDTEFTRRLYETQAVTVLPGSYLARDAHGTNPGANRIRIALVAPLEECVEGARRIASFAASL
jgi:N-succinyldiaminopimelate aminotransferase